MFEYVTNTTYEEVASTLREASRVALTTHQKPDGDAMGSVLALSRALNGRADIILIGPLEKSLAGTAYDTPYTCEDTPQPGDDYDVIVVADTGAWSQVEPLKAWLGRHHERIIGLDHHARGDDIAARRIVDTSAASTTQMLLPLMKALGVVIDGERGGIGEALFVGLATDTGWFRHANADAAAFDAASRLLDVGVDRSRLYQELEETHKPSRLGLAGRALASVEYLHDGSVAIMSLEPDDFAQTGGSLEDLTNLVNVPMCVGTVQVSILLTQTQPGLTKLSFRSKPWRSSGADPLETLRDVNTLAHRFGGGGHVHAAGARIAQDIEAARSDLRAQMNV
jgi:phosphoesterase RecJ-like protein